MELYFNEGAKFTRWIAKNGLLAEPFVLVDVGVQCGEHKYWHLLGDYLVVHGFDALEEAIARLRRQNAWRSNRHYHAVAAGNVDEERTFYFNAANPTTSSMFRPSAGRFDVPIREQARKVQVRRLDTLLAQGVIPRADFLKVDVEGFEPDVLLGAHQLIAGGVLGVATETNFGISPVYRNGHFSAVAHLLLGHGLLVFDIAFDRVPRASFQRALAAKRSLPVTVPKGIGKPSTLNVLFCRDPIQEADEPDSYPARPHSISLDQLIKLIVIYELHGLNDIAVDTVERFSSRLGSRFDVQHAIELLADPYCRHENLDTVLGRRISEIEQSTSWRITAPLRALKRTLHKLVPMV
jgi:FkbM family methyltransferase